MDKSKILNFDTVGLVWNKPMDEKKAAVSLKEALKLINWDEVNRIKFKPISLKQLELHFPYIIRHRKFK